MFQLFVISTVYTDRIRVVLGAMHLLALTILVTAALTGALRIRRLRLLRAAGVTLLLTIVCLAGIRFYLARSFRDAYTADQALVRMHTVLENTGPVTAYLENVPPPLPLDPERSRLHQIRERGVLRVGFLRDRLPFAFVNSAGQAVGFDLEMARHLAQDLGVHLELVRLEQGNHFGRLADGTCDLLMSGLVLTPSKPLRASFTRPYLEQTLAFLMPDYRRRDFSSRDAIQRQRDLRIGVPDFLASWGPRLAGYLSDAEVVGVTSPRPFLRGQASQLDAILYTAEAGSAWTLLYPSFSVAVPQPAVVKVPMAYAVPFGDRELTDYMNSWIEVNRRDGTINILFNHWILGQGARDTRPRWSVLRNVLHWID
jgi:ABC-type amino acid transport substrate-binding protein